MGWGGGWGVRWLGEACCNIESRSSLSQCTLSVPNDRRRSGAGLAGSLGTVLIACLAAAAPLPSIIRASLFWSNV